MSLKGGCFCGAVRYELKGEPLSQGVCFCHDCRLITGTDGWPVYMAKVSDFSIIKGNAVVFEKTAKSNRRVLINFCGTCSTTMWGETELGFISVGAGTLDDPKVFHPTLGAFISQAPHWARPADDLFDAGELEDIDKLLE